MSPISGSLAYLGALFRPLDLEGGCNGSVKWELGEKLAGATSCRNLKFSELVRSH